MITFTTGNLLHADTQALVNTVNTVGVMGKGIALMFKDTFPDNFKAYHAACKAKKIRVGEVFIFELSGLIGPRWIVNFPTKAHWRFPSKVEWIKSGLADLKNKIEALGIRSIAIPPLGSGNGGLDWSVVKQIIVDVLGDVDAEVIVYEPVAAYQNVEKRNGQMALTPARALIADLIRRYCILGVECTILEAQKLAYLADRLANVLQIDGLHFNFSANKYGPYSDKLRHLLDAMDGSYLHCHRRVADAGPFERIRFEDSRRDFVAVYFTTPEARAYQQVLEKTASLIDGFESPLGMELLATVDWLISHEGVQPTAKAIRESLRNWPGGKQAAARKLRLFEDRIIEISLEALSEAELFSAAA